MIVPNCGYREGPVTTRQSVLRLLETTQRVTHMVISAARLLSSPPPNQPTSSNVPLPRSRHTRPLLAHQLFLDLLCHHHWGIRGLTTSQAVTGPHRGAVSRSGDRSTAQSQAVPLLPSRRGMWSTRGGAGAGDIFWKPCHLEQEQFSKDKIMMMMNKEDGRKLLEVMACSWHRLGDSLMVYTCAQTHQVVHITYGRLLDAIPQGSSFNSTISCRACLNVCRLAPQPEGLLTH